MRTKIKEIGVRKRPADLIYSLDETPPLPHLLGLGFQHVAVICPYLVMVALVAIATQENDGVCSCTHIVKPCQAAVSLRR